MADTSTELADVLEQARRFADEVIEPNAERYEVEGAIDRRAFTIAGSLGLCGLVVPTELGGRGLGASGMSGVMKTLAASCMSTAFALVVHNNLAGNIARNGTPAQRERFLPAMLRGEQIGAFLLTEPQGGSDPAATRTQATPADGGWRLNGEKAWVSNGTIADVLSVYAQTDPQAGWRGIACFLVAGDNPGLARGAPYRLIRGHALGTSPITFASCHLSLDALLVGPGDAFKAAMEGIDLARVNVAAMCCGMLERGLEEALAFAAPRSLFGQGVLDFQGLQWMLADVATDLEAASLLTERAAALLERGEDATLAAAHAKKFATRVAFKGLSDCMQVLGAHGLDAARPLARHLAAAKIAQFLDGTTEIQNHVISRRLVGRTAGPGTAGRHDAR